MNNAEQQWDSMSDKQKVEWLATFMGWKSHGGDKIEIHPMRAIRTWNPLTDWNHWRSVEMKVMADSELFEAFLMQIDMGRGVGWEDRVARLCRAELPTRAKALFLAFHSLPL